MKTVFVFAALGILLLHVVSALAQTTTPAEQEAAIRQLVKDRDNQDAAIKQLVTDRDNLLSEIASLRSVLPSSTGITASTVDKMIMDRAVLDGGKAHQDMLYLLFTAAGYEGKALEDQVAKYLTLHNKRKHAEARKLMVEAGKKIAAKPTAVELAKQVISTTEFQTAVSTIAEREAEKKVAEVRESLKNLRSQVAKRNSEVDAKFQSIFAEFAKIPRAFKEAKTVSDVAMALTDIESLSGRLRELDRTVRFQSTTLAGVDMQDWTESVDKSLKDLTDWRIYGKQMLQANQEALNALSNTLSENDPENGRGKKKIRADAERAKTAVASASRVKVQWDFASADSADEPESDPTEETTESSDE